LPLCPPGAVQAPCTPFGDESLFAFAFTLFTLNS